MGGLVNSYEVGARHQSFDLFPNQSLACLDN
jgi:hypothetical protein